MKIPSLLNPEAVEYFARERSLSSPSCGPSEDEPDFDSAELSIARRQMPKECRDAPKFQKGVPLEPVRFPPSVVQDLSIQRKLQHFQIYPEEALDEYPCHIPYRSDKRTLQKKTGREAIEAFQYTYRFGGRRWTVMWDYNIGLVRITPFFKSLGYFKTIPSKSISTNPGLRDLCHSITGGAIVAQGYWVPFTAAKALAARFCWKIRYALIPLFGEDFLKICVDPESPIFEDYLIDQDIIQQCKDDALRWSTSLGSKQPRIRKGPKANKRSTAELDDNQHRASASRHVHYGQESLRPFKVPCWSAANTVRSTVKSTCKHPSRSQSPFNGPIDEGGIVHPKEESDCQHLKEMDQSCSQVNLEDVTRAPKRKRTESFDPEIREAAQALIQLARDAGAVIRDD